jgi:DNA-binding NarL/FixJ family response regulator
MDDGGARQPLRVVVVDDEWLVRAGLTTMLAGTDDIRVVGEAGDGANVADLVRSTRADVVLMDLRMPGVDGITATRRLRGSRAAVIVLTTFDTDELVLQALRAGASGFLVKDTPPAEIAEAVRRAARDEPTLSPSAARTLISRLADADAEDRRARARVALARLTDGERRVAQAVGEGMSNAEIAASLYMSIATIKSYVSRILLKLDLGNRVQIALLVHDAG